MGPSLGIGYGVVVILPLIFTICWIWAVSEAATTPEGAIFDVTPRVTLLLDRRAD